MNFYRNSTFRKIWRRKGMTRNITIQNFGDEQCDEKSDKVWNTLPEYFEDENRVINNIS
jgi:hypothetical protein